MKLPFSIFPGSWGLRGKTRQIAEAEYYLEGYELECALAKINSLTEYEHARRMIEVDRNHKKISDYDADFATLYLDFKYGKISNCEYEINKNNVELKYSKIDEYTHDNNQIDIDLKYDIIDDKNAQKKHIALDLKHNKIDEYSADMRAADLENPADSNKLQLARLEIDLKYNKIAQTDYERRHADLMGEPYMAMPKISWDPVDPTKTYFELDYNDHFVEHLRNHGYKGAEEDIINEWLNGVCASVLSELSENDEEYVRPVKTIKRDDGKTEYL